MISFVPSWKLVGQGIAFCGAIGFTVATMYGADSASKPRSMPPAKEAGPRRAATSPVTVPIGAPADEPVSDPFLASGSNSSGNSFGGAGSDGGDVPDGAPQGGSEIPPPVVSESSVPIALPISAVLFVGVGAGIVRFRRRRDRVVDRR